MNVALYLRMSTDRQEHSIADQRAELKKLAARKSYRIVEEYADEGISGDSTEKRLAFQRMIQDASKGRFQRVLCWDQDRFGRFDPLEAGYWIRPLRMAGVDLETVAQGVIDWNDFSNRMIWTIQQEAKHAYLRDLSRNSLRGLIARTKNGQWSGAAPYGYEIGDDGRLSPLEDEAEIVREVFRLRLLGFGYRVIANKINELGAKPPESERWSNDSIRHILTRETYCGVIAQGAKRTGKYFTTLGTDPVPLSEARRLPKKPLRIENAHPAIITPELFASAQAITRGKPRAHSRNGNDGKPLSGIAYCSCGHVMYTMPRGEVYICGRYKNARGCGFKTVSQKEAFDAVVKYMQKRVFVQREILIPKIQAKLDRACDPPAGRQRAGIESRLRKIEQQIENAVERLLSAPASVATLVQKKLLELQAEQSALQERLAATRENRRDRIAKDIAEELWRFRELIEHGTPAESRAALRVFVDRVVFDFKRIGATGRGEQWRCTGGTIHLRECSEQCGSPSGTPLFGASEIAIPAAEFRATA